MGKRMNKLLLHYIPLSLRILTSMIEALNISKAQSISKWKAHASLSKQCYT